MHNDLRGKTVVITGASSGIGKSIALRFAKRGARLMLCGRRQEALQRVADEAGSATTQVEISVLDVCDRGAVERMVREAERDLGRVDIVIAAAGEYVRVHGTKVSLEDVRRSMEVNFFGTVHLFLAALPLFLERRAGHLMAISSVDGKKGLPFDAPYVASKFAVTGFMDSMRQDLRGTGVRVTAILPGRVDTPMIGNLDVPWISRKISPERVASVVERALDGRHPEVVVPLLGPKTLLWAAAVSPRLADFLIRLFGIEGKQSGNSRNQR
ncbi:MAG: SDR family NAD(P)-dependent oxidoreductase [Bacteroidota bacterium]